MKQLRLVVNESCCDNVAGSKPTNSELCKWLIYFLRGICDVALTIAMSLQYLLNDSTKKENCRKQSVSYNICRVSQQAWALGNQSSGILSQQKTRHRQTSITTNVAGISYQTEKARPTNHSSPGMERYFAAFAPCSVKFNFYFFFPICRRRGREHRNYRTFHAQAKTIVYEQEK